MTSESVPGATVAGGQGCLLTVRQPEVLLRILSTFSFLDEARWCFDCNYTLINYVSDDLGDDEKLLTHWLCYVMDRGTPFRRIWDVAGFVISEIVAHYTAGATLPELIALHVDDADGGWRLRAHSPANRLLQVWYGTDQSEVVFESRFPANYVSLFRTLARLEGYSRSLGEYLRQALRDADYAQGIDRMAGAMDELTYRGVGRVSNEGTADRVRQEIAGASDFGPSGSGVQDRFNRKRLWCALRDYLKSPEFNPVFRSAVGAAGDRWSRSDPELRRTLWRLELPGDVWNNRAPFWQGLFRPYVDGMEGARAPQLARAMHTGLVELGYGSRLTFYPEQLDVTFDFVPRMCEVRACAVCPFGGGIAESCHGQSDLLCPVLLQSCGYRFRCDPSLCTLRADSARGACANYGRTGHR